MFDKFVMRLTLLALLASCSDGASTKRAYEVIDEDDRNPLAVGLNKVGSAPIALSDIDVASLSKRLALDDGENNFVESNELQEEPSLEVHQFQPENHLRDDASVNPGALLRLTKKGLDYGTQIATRLLEAMVRTTAIPDFESNEHGLESRVYKLQLTQFAMPSLNYRLISPSSLAFDANGGSAAIRGDFEAKFLFISVSGSFDASISNLGVGIQMQLLANSQGKPQVSNVGCSANVGNLDFKIHGAGILGWIVNLFDGFIKTYLKSEMQELVIKKVKQFMNERGNHFLSNLVTDIEIDGLQLDYRLTGNANVHDPFFDLSLKGETKLNDQSDTPFSAAVLDMPSTERTMAAIFLSDYVLNSFLYQAHKAALSQFQLDQTRGITPFLRTSCEMKEYCIGILFPELATKHPNTTGQLHVRTKTNPNMQFLPSRAKFVFNVIAELTVANETFLFDVHGDFDLKSAEVAGVDNYITAKVAINDLGVTVIQGTVPEMEKLVIVGKKIAQLKLNELGRKGFPLPAWHGLQLQNIEMSFLSHTFLIACDILYSST